MEKLEIPYFAEKKELFKFLIENKSQIEAQKKMIIKEGDGFGFIHSLINPKGEAIKANTPLTEIPDEYKIRAIINTTNLIDSHMDMHVPGLWKKSLSENKMIMHLQEHMRGFKNVISDGKNLKAYTQQYSWKDLGAEYDGITEALVFDSVIKEAGKKPRNEYMYEQYSSGYVKNHSVAMQYVKMALCVNEPDDTYFGAEFEAWEKYSPMVANKEALEIGYFWAIKEAKALEGSAVVLGSNHITPTENNNLKSIPEPGNHSDDEPVQTTHEAGIDYKYLLENFKL
jgi:hypothetical protein